MKHQLCRNCGHRHALGAPCVLPDTGESEAQKNAEEESFEGPPSIKAARSERVVVEVSEKTSGPAREKGRLTPAQKQKAYRERDPDRKREMDSLRKRKKRDEQT